MTPALRKFNLTAHITSSVGWLGAVASFLVLSIAGLTSRDVEIVRSAYLAMNLIGQFIIVPLSIAALLTGIVQSVGTHWGLFRYYWVLVKFILTIGATLLLLLHQYVAVTGAARQVSGALPGTLPTVGRLGTQLAGDAGLAVLVLFVITALGVYKPWGRTPYGRRKERQDRCQAQGEMPVATPALLHAPSVDMTGGPLSPRFKIFLVILGVIVTAFVVLHLVRGGFGSHAH